MLRNIVFASLSVMAMALAPRSGTYCAKWESEENFMIRNVQVEIQGKQIRILADKSVFGRTSKSPLADFSMEEEEMLMIKAKEPFTTFMASLFEFDSEPERNMPELLAFHYNAEDDQLEWPAMYVNTIEVLKVLIQQTPRVFKRCDNNQAPAAAAIAYSYAH